MQEKSGSGPSENCVVTMEPNICVDGEQFSINRKAGHEESFFEISSDQNELLAIVFYGFLSDTGFGNLCEKPAIQISDQKLELQSKILWPDEVCAGQIIYAVPDLAAHGLSVEFVSAS